MDQEPNDYFKNHGQRSSNGIIVPVEGIRRKHSTASLKPNLPSVPGPSSQSQYSQNILHQQQQEASSPSPSKKSISVSDLGLDKKKECRDFDDVIASICTNGKYQKRLVNFVFAPLSILQPILVFNAVFMLFTPDHWCAGPDMKNWVDPEEYKLVNIPMVNGTHGQMKYSSCSMYGPNQSQIPCPYGWEYDKSEYRETMTSVNGWVCDNAKIPTYILLASTIGNAIGTLTYGLMSDKLGRKPALFCAISINLVFRSISLFLGSHWYLHCIAQFFIGSSHTYLYMGPALIAAELSSKDDRAEVYAITWTVCLFGIAGLPFIAWLCSNWFLIGVATTAIGISMLLYYPIVPESPRWLLQKGRVDEAAAILKKVQTYNNRYAEKKDKRKRKKEAAAMSSDQEDNAQQHAQIEKRNSSESARIERNNQDHIKCLLKQVLENQHNDEERLSIAEGRGPQLEDRSNATVLFTKKNLAKNTILLTICWSMNALIYSTMHYNSTNMSGSHFKNFFLLGLIEVPSGFFGGYLADTLGRRWTQSFSFGLCALTCFATSMLVHHRELEVLMATMSKMIITVSFLVMYCQGCELFPTELRTTGSGIASTVGNFVSIVAPLISGLSTTSAAYPWSIMAICSVVGMIFSAFIPETLNRRLPETIDEANNIGKDSQFWSIGGHKAEKTANRKKRISLTKSVGSE